MIHGLLRGIRRCLLRVTQGFAARRRPGARRKRGGFMGRAGIDLFIEDGAYTTLSSAVVRGDAPACFSLIVAHPS